MVLKNQCGSSRHLPRFSTISWGGPSCTSLVICCGPSHHFPGFSTISWGEDLVQALWFCWSIFFARVLVEVQFLGYKFGLKGSTYTQENTVVNLFVNVSDVYVHVPIVLDLQQLTASMGNSSVLNYRSIHCKFMVQNCGTRYWPHWEKILNPPSKEI